jgi:ankyrin repeat protein
VEPDLAKVVKDGSTPLMWLPDDDARAKEIAELLLANGADPSIKSYAAGWGNSIEQQEGKTAADYARKRGLYEAAELLDSRVNASAPGSPNNSAGSADPGDAVDQSLVS